MADIRSTTKVEGPDASDAAITQNPILSGGRASDAVVTPVSADGDAVALWVSRRGALIAANVDHIPYDGAPFTFTAKTAQYTTAQTGVALWTPTATKRLIIKSFQIQTTGTVGGDVQLWFGASGDTVYTRGTDLALFDGNFIPSATFSPGAIQTGIWIASAVDHILNVTDSAAINALTVTVWGYEF